MRVAVVTPERVLWDEDADFVLARSADGDIGILPGHAPFLGALGYARLIVQAGQSSKIIAVDGGFIEVLDDRVTVLTGSAELAEEIDVTRARRELEDAESALRQEETDERRLALLRASARVQTAAEAGLLDIG
jgi:F-type H+-transporting ATPase subunit epsilon